MLAACATPAPELTAVPLAPVVVLRPSPSCNFRDRVLEHLARKYGEAPIAAGVTNTGGLVEVLTTGDGNTWTIIVTTPQGMSCMVAAGEGWRSMEWAIEKPET